MKRLKAYFDAHQYPISLVMLPLVMLCIPLGPSAKSISVILAIIFILCSNQARANFRVLGSETFVWIILAFLSFAILGCLWSDANLHQKLAVIEKYSKLLYIPLFAAGFSHKKTRHYSIQAYLCGMFITCCTYFYIYWFNNPDPNSSHIPASGYIFYNHIVASYMMAFATYLAAWMAGRTPKMPYKIGYSALVFLFSLYILTQSGSRTGYVIYALLFILFFVQHFSLKSVRYTAIFFALIFTALIQLTHSNTLTKGIQLVSQNLHAYQSGDKYSSVGLRLQFHNYAKSLFLAKPIAGQGTGGFGFRFRQDNPVPGWDLTHPDPHSQYWHTASELGLIGILLLLLLLGALYKLSFALQEMKPILQAVILPFCVVCFSDTVLLTSGIGYLFVTFTGLCLGELIALRQITQTEIIQPAVKRSEYGLE